MNFTMDTEIDKKNNNITLDSEKKMSSGRLEISVRGSKRNVKAFTIFETEKIALSTFNDTKNNFYKISSSCLTFGTGVLIEALFCGWTNIEFFAKAITICGTSFSCIGAISFFVFGRRFAKSIINLDRLIEIETQHEDLNDL